MPFMVGAIAGVFALVVAICLVEMGKGNLYTFWSGLGLALVGSALLATSCFLFPVSTFPSSPDLLPFLRYVGSVLFRAAGPIVGLCGLYVMGKPGRGGDATRR